MDLGLVGHVGWQAAHMEVHIMLAACYLPVSDPRPCKVALTSMLHFFLSN